MPIYALAAGISFCNAGGQQVFLDLPADRYFCLSPASERAFTHLADRAPLDAEDHEHLAALAEKGVLRVVAHDSAVPAPARSVRAQRSLADANGTTRAVDVAIAAVALLRARSSLRRRPLSQLIGTVERRKSNLFATPHQSQDRLVQTAGAFRRAALLTGSLDQCLAVSLAMMHRTLSQRLATELVLGVKLRPFQAHAWVQAGELLVSDRLDTIAPFTPILVI